MVCILDGETGFQLAVVLVNGGLLSHSKTHTHAPARYRPQ